MKKNVCYWCGLLVKPGEGGREHLVPRTILQDTTTDISNLIISKKNSHKKCNKYFADNYEHDFCQILFNYSFGDIKATKHNASKIQNLKSKTTYLSNQFKKKIKIGNTTLTKPSERENESFNMVVQKIIKGLYFKN